MRGITATDEEIEARVGALAQRLFESALASIDLMTVYLGVRLGLYDALAAAGPVTPAELAARAGIAERYAQEWLEQQTVAGIIECDDRTAAADARRYSLPAGHEIVLLDPESPASSAPMYGYR